MTFTGREADASGLMYNRARFYDSTRQRFLSQDPIGFAGGGNVFAYVENRPTLLTDPLGLKPAAGSGPGGGGPSSDPDRAGGSPRGRGRRELNRNPDFRRYYHRDWKPQNVPTGTDERNPDASDDELDEALRDWEREGKPSGDNDQGWDRTKRDVKEMVDWANRHRNEILITTGAVVLVGGVIILSGGFAGGLVVVAVF